MTNCWSCREELIAGENWNDYHVNKNPTCKECHRKNNRRYQAKQNAKKMYVNGKYVPITHPLHKPGNYKTFNDAAFSSLANYVLSTEGEVYVIKNPAWKNWYKIGKAIDSTDRCSGYQTSSPHRDYELVTYKKVKHRGVAEKMAHSLAESLSRKRANEWFYIENLGKEDFDKMLGLIDGLIEEKIQNDRTGTDKKSA